MQLTFEQHTFGSSSLSRIIGFACNRAWAYISFFSIALFHMPASLEASLKSGLYLWSIVALTLTLIGIGVFHKTFERLYAKQNFVFAGPVIASAGSALIPFIGGDLGAITLGAAAVLTGVGSALLLISWGVSFSKLPLSTLIVESCAAYFLGVVAFALFSTMHSAMQYLFAIALPILSGWMNLNADAEPAGSYEKPKPSEQVSPLWRVAVGIFVLGFAAGFMRDIRTVDSSTGYPSEYFATYLSVMAIAVVIFLVLSRNNKVLNVDLLLRPAVVVMTLGVMLLPILGEESLAPAAMTKAGYTCFEMLVWVMIGALCHRNRLSPVSIFALGRALIAGSGLLGSAVAPVASPLIMENPTYTVVLSFGLAAVLMILSSFILTNETLSRLWETPAKKQPTFKKRCYEAFDLYELSDRQKEIAYLIASGRDANYISENLYISKGTLNSHRLRIYRKLDIHSRQELLDLVAEETKKNAEPNLD